MLSLFSKGESSALQEKESNSFNVTSFLGLSGGASSAKKASSGTPKPKAENYLDVTKELKELKSISVSKNVDKNSKKESASKEKSFSKDSRDVNRSSHPIRGDSYDKAKEYRRDEDRSNRKDEFTIKRKVNYDDSDIGSPQIKKLDSTKKPQAPSSMSSSKPVQRPTSQQSTSKPQGSVVNRSGPVTAQAKGRDLATFHAEKQPKYVVPGQQQKRPSSGSGSGSGSLSKPGSGVVRPAGSGVVRPSGSGVVRPSGSQSSGLNKSGLANKPMAGRPNPMQAKPSSGNTMSRPINGKPVPSGMGSRPSSQQPIKKPGPNGTMVKPSSNGTLSKAKPIAKSITPPAPAVRYINGKAVPIKGAEPQGRPNGGNLGKRPGDHLPNSRYEPNTGKKPVTSFSSVFKGGPSKKPNRHYDSEDEDDYDDDFIDDGDEDVEAQNEMKKMFGRYRQRVERTRHLLDDVDNMEAGYDMIEKEEEISKLIGEEEDRRQFELIKREAAEEAARERDRMKKRKLQLD